MGCVDDRRIPPRRSRIRARARSPARPLTGRGMGRPPRRPHRDSRGRGPRLSQRRCGRSDRPGGGAVRDRTVLHGRSLRRTGLPALRGGQLAGVDLRPARAVAPGRGDDAALAAYGGRGERGGPSRYCCSRRCSWAATRPHAPRSGRPRGTAPLPSRCSRTARATAPRRAHGRRPGRASAGRATSLRRRRCRA